MIQLIVNNVYTKAVSSSAREHNAINGCLTYKIPQWRNIKKQMLKKQPRSQYWKRWNGSKSFYHTQHYFLTGLLRHVTDHLRKMGITYEVMDARHKPLTPAPVDKNMLEGITLYDFQERTVREVIKKGRGVVQLPTGAGKTEIAIAVTKAANVPTLFLTHRVNLLYQTAKRYASRAPEYKDKIGVIGDSNYTPNFITLATVQTIQSLLKRYPEQIKDILAQYQNLIVDEAHRFGSDQFNEPGKYCTNAFYRIGLTATPFMKGNVQADMYLLGITGPVAHRITNYELIERGILARPFFKFFTIEGDLNGCSSWRDIYEKGIIYHKQRNLFIAKQAAKLASSGKKILIIVQEVKHGQILAKLCSDEGVKVMYQDGKNTYAEREKALKWIAKNGDCIIATNIFDEGIDVNEINSIILAAGTRSAPAILQRTGRALRRKEEDNYAVIIDFIDKQHPKLLEHSLSRYNTIKHENGFTIL